MPISTPNMQAQATDYRLAFDLAPVGMVLSRHRTMLDCNQAVCDMFGASRDQLVGQSFRILYPSADEFERTGERLVPLLNAGGRYADDRIMKRLAGRFKNQTFWCHVTGRALDPQDPHASGIWTFEDLSASRPVTAELTAREREVATLVTQGYTAKLIGKTLNISPRTVEIYRARLLRKYNATSTVDLVQKLVRG